MSQKAQNPISRLARSVDGGRPDMADFEPAASYPSAKLREGGLIGSFSQRSLVQNPALGPVKP